MALTDRRPLERPTEASSAAGVAPRGFRPASRRRSRIAAGAAVAAVAVGGNVLLYTSLDDKTEVLQMSRTVRAGQVVTVDDLRIVEVDVDPTVRVIEAGEIGRVVNSYARVFLPEGSLVVDGLVQPDPLVSNDAAVVAVEIRPSRVPTGLTERSQVLLVILGSGSDAAPTTITARVVTSGKGAEAEAGGVQAMSVEVAVADAPVVAAADDIRLVLLDPGVDPVTEAGG